MKDGGSNVEGMGGDEGYGREMKDKEDRVIKHGLPALIQ